MIMTCSLVESWNKVILINTKCQGIGVEKRPQNKIQRRKELKGEQI